MNFTLNHLTISLFIKDKIYQQIGNLKIGKIKSSCFFFIDVWLKITINHFAISRSKICKLYFYQDSTITFFIDKSVNLVTFTSCVCLFYVKRYNGTLKYKELGNQNDPIKIFKNAFKRERITSKRLQWGIVF